MRSSECRCRAYGQRAANADGLCSDTDFLPLARLCAFQPGIFLEIAMAMLHEHDPDLHAIALEAVARSLVEQWARDQYKAGEAGMCLSDDEYDAITAAYCSGDALAHFQATDKAIRRVLAERAEREAEQELERKQREERRRHEEDRAADRAEFRRAFA